MMDFFANSPYYMAIITPLTLALSIGTLITGGIIVGLFWEMSESKQYRSRCLLGAVVCSIILLIITCANIILPSKEALLEYKKSQQQAEVHK